MSLPYSSWIAGYFPGVTDPATIGNTADPDRDGIANAVEMVLGGNPATATDRVRVFVPKGSNAKLFGRLNVMVP